MPEQNIVELLKKVRRVQIVANRTVNDLMAGQYKSVFRGRGMEFDEVREYQPGDDIRTIDWNVTARTGVPHIKRFCEERELTVLLLVDVSASGVFGSGRQSKLDLAVEVAACLMVSALKNNDKVGLLTFGRDVVDYFPPRKGKTNVLRLIRQLIAAEPARGETRLDAALDYLNRVQKRRAVVFLLSDFLTPGAGQAVGQVGNPIVGQVGNLSYKKLAGVGQVGNLSYNGTYQHALAVAARRHDLIAVAVSDPREHNFPDVDFLTLQDAETGAQVEVDARHPRVRALFQQRADVRAGKLADSFKRIGVDQLVLQTDADYSRDFRRFFHMRERRFR
jgi:uncharacterized protein (DUF58 family)